MWNCKYCNKEYLFTRTTEKANHAKHCEFNPKREAFYASLRDSAKKRFNQSLGEYKIFTVSCAKCNTLTHVKERELQHPAKDKYFCSRSCANSQGGQAKSELYHTDELATYVTVAWRYHERKCLVCGEDKIVAVHHLNENHSDNDPKNLVPLCPTHHQYMHSKHKILIQDKVDKYVKNRWAMGLLG